ncbi:MAG: glycosyltransferase [Candidatus Bathyarchaeota archaeon]|nr:MAG: glycosyltransferase [Candidatus Bathyarchaeota archaeon]
MKYKASIPLACSLIVVGFTIPKFLNLAIDVTVLISFFSQLGYVITYLSLLICLITVIITFIWFPSVRRRFSSPIRHSGLSVMKLLLVTTIFIILLQIVILFLVPNLLYQIAFYLFFISLIMFTIRSSVTFSGALLHKRRERSDLHLKNLNRTPLVTVIVPAYNEEDAISKTVESLLTLSYPKKEIIIVDDGSTDGTLEVARRFVDDNLVKLVSKPNGGKWDALNAGIREAQGEFIVCIDADTLLDRDAIQHLIKHFQDPRVAAVAGNVKVGNRTGILAKLQALEYVVGINLHRRSEASLQNVTVVPGPIGAFRVSVLKEIGLFEGDTFAEDADLTLKILKAGHKTVFDATACAYTEAPESMTSLAKQRYRWYRGSLQVLSKHRDLTFSRKHGRTGTFVMPWTVFNGVIFPWFMFFTMMWLLVFCFNPISPYTIYQPRIGGPPEWTSGPSSPSRGQGPSTPPTTQIGITIDLFQTIPYIYVFWFFAFVLLEIAIAAYALSLDIKEKRSLLLYAGLYRLVYLYVVDIIRMLSQLEEVFHYPMKWEKLDHYGSVNV